MSYSSYNYYDTPEGQDIHKKLWVTTQYAGATGLAISTTDVMLYSHPKGYLPTIGRFLYITGPIIGIATAFVTVSNLGVSLRGKNDKWNYAFGAWASGGILGAWRRSPMLGILSSIGFTIAALIKKEAIDQGWELMPKDLKLQHGTLRGSRHDWTLTAERPRNWTTGEETEKK